ncbi:hypothetical protein [Streptomyces sp. NPDC002671]
MTDSLTDVHRIAQSRGARLPFLAGYDPDPDGRDDEDDESPAEAAG